MSCRRGGEIELRGGRVVGQVEDGVVSDERLAPLRDLDFCVEFATCNVCVLAFSPCAACVPLGRGIGPTPTPEWSVSVDTRVCEVTLAESSEWSSESNLEAQATSSEVDLRGVGLRGTLSLARL